MAKTAARPSRWVLVLVLYLLGLFMGAIDTGIITPARVVVQRDLGVDDQLGVWMLTIYTLAYASAIPIMGKLADRIGRKQVYLVSIALFGIGSLACGLSQDFGSFQMLIVARAVQAIGGGGILPIATAEIGTSVPPEKRGMALGLVGGVYGIANIFGASAGSLILDIAGTHNWQWIFYVNVPIALLIVVAGVVFLPKHAVDGVKPLDVVGSLLLVGVILSLLYGLKGLSFVDLAGSFTSMDVWPLLALSAVLLVPFILVERRAADPVLNLAYFTDRGIALVLMLSFLSGVVLMAVAFVPQFAENALRIPTGSGGYLVIILGLASGVGAPMSGKLTDRLGAKTVLAAGGTLSAAAGVAAIVWVIPQPGWPSVLTVLILFGLGLGFVIGSPLNYLMLALTPAKESNSALATSSLVRAIGTTLAPAIMVGFLASAGTQMQDNLMGQLPTTVSIPALPHAAELQTKIDALKTDERTRDQMDGLSMPDLNAKDTITIDPNGGGELPADLVELLKTADVTNVTARAKIVATRMFNEETPKRVSEITEGVNKGLASLDAAKSKLDGTLADMAKGLREMDDNLAKMADGIAEMDAKVPTLKAQIADMGKALAGMAQGINGMTQGVAGLQQAVVGQKQGLAQQQAALAAMEAKLPSVQGTPGEAALRGQIEGLRAGIKALTSQLTATETKLSETKAKLASTKDARAKLATGRAGAKTGLTKVTEARAKLARGRAELTKARADLASGRLEVQKARTDLDTTVTQLTELRDAVPSAFDTALANYLGAIDGRGPSLEVTYQRTLSQGFVGVFAVYIAGAVLMLALLPLIPRRKRAAADEGEVSADS